MPVLYLSKKAAAHMRKHLNFGEEEEKVIVYSFEVIFHTVFTIAAIYLAAWLAGCVPATMTVLAVASLLRSFSGGAHNESPLNCTLKCVAVYTLTGWIATVFGGQIPLLANAGFALLALLISLRLIWIYAPVDNPAKPITSESYRRKLRRLSLFAAVAISILQLTLLGLNYSLYAPYSLAAALGMIWQVSTLTPAGHKLVSIIDNISNKIKGGEKK